MTGTITENQVVKLWQEFMPGQADLATEEGGKVSVELDDKESEALKRYLEKINR